MFLSGIHDWPVEGLATKSCLVCASRKKEYIYYIARALKVVKLVSFLLLKKLLSKRIRRPKPLLFLAYILTGYSIICVMLN